MGLQHIRGKDPSHQAIVLGPRSQILVPSAAAFPDTLVGGCIGSEVAGTERVDHLGFEFHRCQPNALQVPEATMCVKAELEKV